MNAATARVPQPAFWTSSTWSVRGVVTATTTLPVIYALLIPFMLLDVGVQIYQWLIFPLLGITRVRRRDYFVLDRHRLPYQDVLQKANCLYCGYANGVLVFVREVAARTEQFWCPIKHVRTPRGAHRRYRQFAAYGDAEAFRHVQPALRRELGSSAPRRQGRRT
jgi:hypothetical protein